MRAGRVAGLVLAVPVSVLVVSAAVHAQDVSSPRPAPVVHVAAHTAATHVSGAGSGVSGTVPALSHVRVPHPRLHVFRRPYLFRRRWYSRNNNNN